LKVKEEEWPVEQEVKRKQTVVGLKMKVRVKYVEQENEKIQHPRKVAHSGLNFPALALMR
jgi:hypothetical protein